MSIPKTPIYPDYTSNFYDADGEFLEHDDIARDLTAYYTLLKMQEECGKTGHKEECRRFNNSNDCRGESFDFCPLCGADLTKGAKT